MPTISVLLGLPIPYANLGGMVPSLLGLNDVRHIAAALALNAAQLWRYFTVYSATANKLPGLSDLELRLNEAVEAYKAALAHHEANDSNLFYKACGLLKMFLVEASELGHRVWTRFDSTGMILGGLVVFLCLVVWVITLSLQHSLSLSNLNRWELGITAIFIIFQCGLLTFSNSYIAAEQGVVIFMMATLGCSICIRWNNPSFTHASYLLPWVPLLFPAVSRTTEILVSGHGMDPSIRLHAAHNPIIFLSSLIALAGFRVYLHQNISTMTKHAVVHVSLDCFSLICLALSWMEKRTQDDSRNGYFWMRGVLIILALGVFTSMVGPILTRQHEDASNARADCRGSLSDINAATPSRPLVAVSKALIFIMAVTGPATAATSVLFVIQVYLLHILGLVTGIHEVCLVVPLWLFHFAQ